MLHELILALHGYSGAYFSCDKLSKYEIIDHHYLHPCEKEIIREILNYGSGFLKIKKFYEKYGQFMRNSHVSTTNCDLREGHYITSLASSLYDETNQYQEEIVSLEESILVEPGLPLSCILIKLQPFDDLFRELGNLVNLVEKNGLHGCQILEATHNSFLSTVGLTNKAMKRINKAVHGVLLRQLSQWLLFGVLIDPHGELFVKIEECRLDESKNETNLDSLDRDVSRIVALSRLKKETELEVGHHLEMLPMHIPPSAVDKIMFIGEAILCFGAKDKNKDGEEDASLLPRERECEFHLILNKLAEKESFALSEFMEELENIRIYMAERLYRLVMSSNFLQELSRLKDTFLLGRGELQQAFFTVAGDKLAFQRIAPNYLNGLYQKAGRQLNLEDFLSKLTLVCDTNAKEEAMDRWKCLRLEYRANWPLHKVFGPKAMEKYNNVLRFLWNIRRVQFRMQNLWTMQMHNKSRLGWDRSKILQWNIRHHMNFLIYNLQYYIQVDVLESQHFQLIQSVLAIRDYQQLVNLHFVFLTTITDQIFLNHSILSSTIDGILLKINEFCDLLEAEDASDTVSQKCDKSLLIKLKALSEDVDMLSGKLFWILSSLMTERSAQHSAKLILKIDYNKYYSNKSSAKRFIDHFSRND